jgi:integrase
MLNESTQLSITFLRAVLAGGSYDAIASAYGLTRTAVERRVKRLACKLQREVGIIGLNREAANYLQKLRDYKDQVEVALKCFESQDVRAPEPPSGMLTDKDIRTMIYRAGLYSSTPLLDAALIHILLATGARPLEVARLEIADYLNPDGSVRGCSEMRASVSVNRKDRPLFFRSSAAVAAIDAYLAHRLSRIGPCPNEAPYRGFAPGERLFLDGKGLPYVVQRLEEDDCVRFLCRSMQETYRRIFKRIDIHGLSARVLRRTVATRLFFRGADEEQIGIILGITEKQDVRKLLPPRPGVAELMTDLYTVE